MLHCGKTPHMASATTAPSRIQLVNLANYGVCSVPAISLRGPAARCICARRLRRAATQVTHRRRRAYRKMRLARVSERAVA